MLEKVIFINTVTNNSDSAAENIIVNNPIPENMLYVDGTATGEKAIITYSVDGGQHYDQPINLIVTGEDGKPRPATGTDYTNVRWQLVSPLAPKAEQKVEFQARVK